MTTFSKNVRISDMRRTTVSVLVCAGALLLATAAQAEWGPPEIAVQGYLTNLVDEPLEGPLRDEKKRGSWTVALDIAVLATTSLRIRLLHFFVPQENGFSGGVSHGSKLAAFVEVSPDDC